LWKEAGNYVIANLKFANCFTNSFDYASAVGHEDASIGCINASIRD